MSEQNKRMILLPGMALLWNQFVYCAGSFLARDRPHLKWDCFLDHWIPLVTWSVSIYFGCFLLWALIYMICARQERSAAYRFFCADFLSKAICLLFFLFLPTTIARPEIHGTALWDYLVRFLYQVDPPYNLFPSIHCLISWLCLIGVRNHPCAPKWLVYLTGAAAAIVFLSTLTTKQHVILDVVGGAVLAEMCYWLAGKRMMRCWYSQMMAIMLRSKTDGR